MSAEQIWFREQRNIIPLIAIKGMKPIAKKRHITFQMFHIFLTNKIKHCKFNLMTPGLDGNGSYFIMCWKFLCWWQVFVTLCKNFVTRLCVCFVDLQVHDWETFHLPIQQEFHWQMVMVDQLKYYLTNDVLNLWEKIMSNLTHLP